MLGTIEEIAAAVEGRLHGDGRKQAAGVSIDTRTIRPGEVFFAIVGERDGHDFVGEAARAGAGAVVVSRRPEAEPSAPWIGVEDTLAALQALGSRCRAGARARVVGLTGSCGKTTTKELLAAALAGAGRVLSTRGNLNNHLGVPLTLVQIGPVHDFAVVEMGASHHGEIELLTRIADPDVGLVTCVAAAHTEFFGDVEGVARAKGELFASMRPDAIAVVNLDDPRVSAMQRRPHGAVTYGSDATASADVLLEGIREAGDGQEISLRVRGDVLCVRLALRGAHNALNATAAVAACVAAGVDPAVAARGLASVEPAPGRGAVRRGRRLELIDDTYNANPASVEAGLALLVSMAGARRTAAMLGDMFELGEDAPSLHRQVGAAAARAGVGCLVAVGTHAGDVRSGALGEGAPADSVFCFETTDAALQTGAVDEILRQGDLVLVKGSRGMKMERLVESLLYW